MAGRDNVLFHGTIAANSAAGTVVPLSLLYGIENVRQGYGTPVLKSIEAWFTGGGTGYLNLGVPIEIKNSNWVDSAGLTAQQYDKDTAFGKGSLSYMRGRDKVLQPNTSWIVNATVPTANSAVVEVYVLFEIAYSAVEGIATENAAGSPVYKKCSNASVTGAANVPVQIGTFDNLLQGVSYVMSEAALLEPVVTASIPTFLVIEGFSSQRDLTRIFPVKAVGDSKQIEGSVTLTKQTYNLSLIRSSALSAAAVTIGLEMIASSN